MGKYMMRKPKFTADVAVMEVPPPHSTTTTLGVRTRAKTLALQRLHQSSSTAPPPPPPPSDLLLSEDNSCYLELRSRRLEKPLRSKPHQSQNQSFSHQQLHMNTTNSNSSSSSSRLRLNNSVASSGSVKSASILCPKIVDHCFENRVPDEAGQGFELVVEASFGENNLDFQHRDDRSSRENTPCSFIREVDDVGTPGSSTKQRQRQRQRTSLEDTNSNNWRRSLRRSHNNNNNNNNIPSAYEMEEFFTHAEQQQQRQFIDKYNFDIVADMPLPGRYDWVSVSQ